MDKENIRNHSRIVKYKVTVSNHTKLRYNTYKRSTQLQKKKQ